MEDTVDLKRWSERKTVAEDDVCTFMQNQSDLVQGAFHVRSAPKLRQGVSIRMPTKHRCYVHTS